MKYPDDIVQLHQLLTDLDQIGFTVRQHRTDPRPGEWYVGLYGKGDLGPYPTAYAALLAGVNWLLQLLAEATEENMHE